MDHNAPTLPSPKTRRRFSPEFKARVVQECQQPGNSTAGVAQKHQLNANLIHKWRRSMLKQKSQAFVPLPAPSVNLSGTGEHDTVRFKLTNGIVVDWPTNRILDSVAWLKALQS